MYIINMFFKILFIGYKMFPVTALPYFVFSFVFSDSDIGVIKSLFQFLLKYPLIKLHRKG